MRVTEEILATLQPRCFLGIVRNGQRGYVYTHEKLAYQLTPFRPELFFYREAYFDNMRHTVGIPESWHFRGGEKCMYIWEHFLKAVEKEELYVFDSALELNRWLCEPVIHDVF